MSTPESGTAFDIDKAIKEHGGRAMTRDGQLVTGLKEWPRCLTADKFPRLLWHKNGFTDHIALDHNPLDLRNLTPEEAKEHGVGKAEPVIEAVRECVRRLNAEHARSKPARPEIDTSRPVEWEGDSIAALQFVGCIPGDEKFPLVYLCQNWEPARFSLTGMPHQSSTYKLPIRNVPEEPKRIKGWVVASSDHLFPTEEAAVVVAKRLRAQGIPAAVFPTENADGDGL